MIASPAGTDSIAQLVSKPKEMNDQVTDIRMIIFLASV